MIENSPHPNESVDPLPDEPFECKLGSNTIEVTSKEFLPEKEKYNPEEVLIFFQGWGTNLEATSYKELFISLADSFGRRVIVVKTRSNNPGDGYFKDEAMAANEFLRKQGIGNTIVTGYSQGGGLALEYTLALQKSGKKPEALFLFAPVGLESQSPLGLVTTFALDVVETIPHLAIERARVRAERESGKLGKIGESLQAGRDIVRGVGQEALRSNLNYFKRLHQEVKEMSQRNPRLKEVRVPVFLIQGDKDRPLGPRGGLVDKETIENALELLFLKSPYRVHLLAKRSGKHAFPLLRPEQVAKVTAYLHERRVRPENQIRV